jgi:purine-binding chemotaxis protein CheW
MSDKEVKVLVFSINGEYYASDIMEVERILPYEETTKLPDSPDFIQGVINHEGNILPVMCLAKKFNIPYSSMMEEKKIIVAKYSDKKIGIIVDLVSEVKDIKQEELEAPPEVVSSISRRYIKGLIKLNGKIIILLNLGAILTEEERILL